MTYPQITLKPGRERQIVEGHPWIFSGAVATMPDGFEPGAIVDVLAADGTFIARGYCNTASSIPVRVLTRDPEQAVDRAFLLRRIREAHDLRRLWLDTRTTNAYRVVHGESDYLPGLIIDRYADYVVVQFHTLGVERLRDLVVDVVQEVLSPTGIHERSDVGTRRPEGLETSPTGPIAGDPPPELLEICENRVSFLIDITGGQKTGFFLDQRENRLGVQAFSRDREVLNCFSYSGGFSVYAARGKASSVTSVDVSEKAVALARQNLELNRFDPDANPCIAANVFDYLKQCKSDGRKYDLVVVDPPAFAKTRATQGTAVRAYISLNRKAIEITRPGGMLVTASCSTQVDYETFFTVVRHAASAARREVQVIRTHLQAVDHPVSSAFPEGRYLKCLFCSVR
jgi:23S rRNA (cytosine1962-C5)-methyltransferase